VHASLQERFQIRLHDSRDAASLGVMPNLSDRPFTLSDALSKCFQLCLQINPNHGGTNAGARRDPPTIKKVRNPHRPEMDTQPRNTTRIELPSEPSACVWIPLLGGATFVMMVQSTDFANLEHLAFGDRLYSPGLRGILAER
jgi:hypothetical protein